MIALLGGTFDPIHYGHLHPAQEVFQRLGLEALHLVPAAIPPHRRPPVATPLQRYDMVTLAAVEFPGFVADDREIRRGGISYTVDTLKQMREEFGGQPLYFLLGADAFAGLTGWHRWEEILQLAHLIVMQRPGTNFSIPAWAAPRMCQEDALADRPAGLIVSVPVTPRDVSATALRAEIASGKQPSSDALPQAVWDYIGRNHLYRSTSA